VKSLEAILQKLKVAPPRSRRRLCRELVEILDEKGGGGAEPWIKAAFVDLMINWNEPAVLKKAA